MSFGSIVELKEYDNCTHVDAQIDVNLEVKFFWQKSSRLICNQVLTTTTNKPKDSTWTLNFGHDHC
jgi:hypothetical protein